MAASHGFQVVRLGFLATNDSYEMGVPNVPLGDLYGSHAWGRMPNVRLRLRAAVEKVNVEGGRITSIVSGGETYTARQYLSAVPFERIGALIPEAGVDTSAFSHSSITSVHLWFDRPVTDLANATLLERNIQWFFNKEEGRYLQLVVSASRNLLEMPRQQVIDLALKELREFLPAASEAKVLKAHVVKEARATFSGVPGLHVHRPEPKTRLENLWLAGDWTNSGWPATMEGAVRSGYKAAEFTAAALDRPARFLLPDILFTCALFAAALPVLADPPMTKIRVEVRKAVNDKPVDRASVVVRFVEGRSVVKLGKKIMTSYQMRTNQDGVATMPPIPQGKIQIQVIAKGMQTFGQIIEIGEEEKTVEVKLNDPQPQYSVHQ
jgi:hypothetical protein